MHTRERSVPAQCPSCGGTPVVVKLRCPSCSTEVSGEFSLCPVCRLPPDARRLFDLFIASRGNLKQVQRALGVSYPTVRQRIEEMFRKMGLPPRGADVPAILAAVRAGELSVDQAERLLRGEPEDRHVR